MATRKSTKRESYILVVENSGPLFITGADIDFAWRAPVAHLKVSNILMDRDIHYAIPFDQITAALIAKQFAKTRKGTLSIVPTAQARAEWRWTRGCL